MRSGRSVRSTIACTGPLRVIPYPIPVTPPCVTISTTMYSRYSKRMSPMTIGRERGTRHVHERTSLMSGSLIGVLPRRFRDDAVEHDPGPRASHVFAAATASATAEDDDRWVRGHLISQRAVDRLAHRQLQFVFSRLAQC